MKGSGKIAIVALVFALVFSVFSFGAAAYTATQTNYREVLEFYESHEYVNEVFDLADYSDAFEDSTDEFSVKGAFSTTELDDGVLVTENMSSASFSVTPDDITSFGFNFGFAFPSGDGKLIVRLTDSDGDVLPIISFIGTKLNAQAQEATLDKENPFANIGVLTLTEDTEYPLTAASYYDVMIYVLKSATVSGEYTVTVRVSDRQTPATVKTYTTVVKDFYLKSFSLDYLSDTTAKAVNLDYIEAYEGSFSHRLNDLDEAVGEYIVSLVDLYKANYGEQYAREILETLNKVVIDYGYSTDNADVISAIEYYCQQHGNIYSVSYVANSAAINTSASYNDRLDASNENARLYKLLAYIDVNFPTMELTADDSAIAAAKLLHDAERATIDLLKSNTIAYITALVNCEPYEDNYAELKTVYDEIKLHPACPTFYDDEYSPDTVSAAIIKGNTVASEFERVDAKARAFVANVAIAANITEKSFIERFNAYKAARDGYYDDASYDVVLVDVTMEDIIATYDDVAEEMTAKSDYAEQFLSKIHAAELSTNYNVKYKTLDEAEPYLADVERGYPGVSDAVTKYEALRVAVSNKISACKAYVEAVLAISTKTTTVDKKAAIVAAQQLAATGNDVTAVEKINGEYVLVSYNGVSVTNANIMLSNELTLINNTETRAQNFVNAVNAIATAKNTGAKRAAINNAMILKASADATLENVIAATAKLDAEIAAYNSKVEAANELEGVALEVGARLSSAVRKDASSGQVIAIIKKFYE